VKDKLVVERVTKSTSAFLKAIVVNRKGSRSKMSSKGFGSSINWNKKFVTDTIETLESEDEKSCVSSDHSEHLKQKRVDRLVMKNIHGESGVEKVNSFLALNQL